MFGTAILVIILLLGATFLVAGIGKRLDRRDDEYTVEYGLLPPRLARAFGRALPWMEMATGALLLASPLYPRFAVGQAAPLGAAVALLAAFSAAVAVVLVRRQEVECHCFGRFGSGRVTLWTLVRNLALLALAGVALQATVSGSATAAYSALSPEDLPRALIGIGVLMTAAMVEEALWLAVLARRADRAVNSQTKPKPIQITAPEPWS